MFRNCCYFLQAMTVIVLITFLVMNKHLYYKYLFSEHSVVQIKEKFKEKETIQQVKPKSFSNITEQIQSINDTFTSLLKTGLQVKTSELVNGLQK